MNEFAEAKAIVRHFFPTLGEMQKVEGHKPLCRYCYVTCDPYSREYRALKVCSYCYGDVPLIIQRKDILHERT